MQFLVPIDLAKNELRNAVIHLLGSPPLSYTEGQVYYDTSSHKLRYRDNAAFRTVLDDSASMVTSVTASSPLASSGGATPDISLTGTISATRGGTGVSDPTVHGILVAQGSAAMSAIVLTAGQILIGTTSGDPSAATITGTTKRLGVTSVSGSITLNIDATQFPQAVTGDVGKALVATAADTAAWGSVGVAGGGTGLASITLHGIMVGEGTSAVNPIVLTNGQLLIGSTGNDPVAAVITGTSNRLGVSVGAGSITLNVDATQFPSATVANTVLVSSAANTASWTTVPVAAGGTGRNTLTIHGVLVGNTTDGINATAAGTAGQALVSGGASADPTFQSSGGDITGVYSNMTVNTVGGASSTNIADAVTKRHSQNTDTGTTSSSFLIDSGGTGVKLADESGLLAVRNAAGDTDADVRARDLTCRNLSVTGTQTIIQSNVVDIGDSFVELNAFITSSASNSDGGLEIARLSSGTTSVEDATNNGGGLIRITSTAHGYQTGDRVRISGVTGTTEANSTVNRPWWSITRIDADSYDLVGSAFVNAWVSGGTVRRHIDAVLAWNNGSGYFESRVGAYSGQTIRKFANKFVLPVGDTSNTSFNIAHNLNSLDVIVQVRKNTGSYDTVSVDVTRVDVNTVTVTFASAPATDAYNVTVIG